MTEANDGGSAMYCRADERRILAEPSSGDPEPYRSEWRRDYARVIHSASWRRLQGKTQLFPGHESDFFRNRLTHSLEVAQVAKSLAFRLNASLPERFHVSPDVCEVAGLCHDLGHPPFGHTGEEALDECMRPFGGFEGNAQTLRIVARLEKKRCPPAWETLGGIDDQKQDQRAGLNLTFRTLASVLKYDVKIPKDRTTDQKVLKGYYEEEDALVQELKRHYGVSGEFKSIECQIMDCADDIAYSTYDLEDAFKAGIISPLSLLSPTREFLQLLANDVAGPDGVPVSPRNIQWILEDTFGRLLLEDPDDPDEKEQLNPMNVVKSAHRMALDLAGNAYARTSFTSELIREFIQSVKVDVNEESPILSKVYFDPDTKEKIETLKKFVFRSVTMGTQLQVGGYRGRKIVKGIWDALNNQNKHAIELLPSDVKVLYSRIGDDMKHRVLCDFIAGMTDRYAVEFHERLYSASPTTMFRPM